MNNFLQEDLRRIREATADLIAAVKKYNSPLMDDARTEFEREMGLADLTKEMRERVGPQGETEEQLNQ